MNDEMSRCDFCSKVKPVSRIAIHPKTSDLKLNYKPVFYCDECGCKEQDELTTIRTIMERLKQLDCQCLPDEWAIKAILGLLL